MKNNIKEIKEDILKIFENLDDTKMIISNDINEKYPQLMDYFFNHGFEVMDYSYLWGSEAIEQISEAINDIDNIEEIIRTVEELEFNIFADDYTSDLTRWLDSRNSNVYYLNEALEQDIQDGFDLLAEAQRIAKEEVYGIVQNTVLDLLNDLLKQN